MKLVCEHNINFHYTMSIKFSWVILVGITMYPVPPLPPPHLTFAAVWYQGFEWTSNVHLWTIAAEGKGWAATMNVHLFMSVHCLRERCSNAILWACLIQLFKMHIPWYVQVCDKCRCHKVRNLCADWVDVVTEKGALFYWHICMKQTQLTVVGGGQCIYVCVCMLNGGMVTIE